MRQTPPWAPPAHAAGFGQLRSPFPPYLSLPHPPWHPVLPGILGNDLGDSGLTGGINMPVDDETYIPLTDEELAQLGIPPSDDSSADAPAAGAPPAGPASAAPAAHGLPAAVLLAAGALLGAALAA